MARRSFRAGRRRWRGAPDHELLDFFQHTYGPLPAEILGYPELLPVISEILRADVHILERYAYATEDPLGCPIRAFGGLCDESTPHAELSAWQAQTAADFAFQMFPGGHFFWEDSMIELVRILRECLGPREDAHRPIVTAGRSSGALATADRGWAEGM